MLELTEAFEGNQFFIMVQQIESVEQKEEHTVISTISGKEYWVEEPASEVFLELKEMYQGA